MKTKYFPDVKIGGALIDMYPKCGKIDDARQIFDYMPEKIIFSWTSMIDGYGKNGKPCEVIEMFGKLQAETQTKPNYITFLCAISACAYAGYVDKAWEIFESMEKDYSLKPRMEHYACMVDLLGRSGNIQQAWEFVMQMPEKPNLDVWAIFWAMKAVLPPQIWVSIFYKFIKLKLPLLIPLAVLPPQIEIKEN